MKLMVRSPFLSAFAVVFCSLLVLTLLEISPAKAQAQAPSESPAGSPTSLPPTDPSEVRALNSMFQKWGISPSESARNGWNISGEPCSGRAIISSIIDSKDYNPGIECDCSANSNSTCHITKLKVYALNAVGTIPEELKTLSFLENVNLAQNYLTGPLPSFIGNLTRMQYFTVGINALSGELPRELGELTNLISLSFSSNNFSGSLPPELGKLVKLEQLYIDSSGVRGEIPSTFASLQNLKTVWASDNQLTGRIPSFIGNWTKLSTLRFQGNSFDGPIPSTFSNLTSLTDLRISDLSNASFSLSFIKDMKALSTLILRNNDINGSIPSNIGGYQSLTLLDLSFNNLTGQLPDTLFNLSSLANLFLGSNKLSGQLPSLKSASLRNIDLSYNELSGSFPAWVTQQNLQINLVANNFTMDGQNSRDLRSGLNCLQRNFPCNRDSPRYSSFAIKCGGSQITSSNQIVFERDNETVGPASYFVTDTNRWAVSNVGLFVDNSDTKYTRFSLSQFTNTLDSELFQSARLSASSLRYYGLGLENGNYTVTLLFSETDFQDSRTWQSTGRRVFDIYVQGNRVFKDFDIRKEAGGASLRAVQKEIKTLVSENFLEIHLFWAGKGTCCIPRQSTYGPSISAISATPVLLGIDARPYTFSYAELRTATEDFSPADKLGEGGFGPVYKGTLSDGRLVAVKQLSVVSHQGKSQFVAEIATISAVQHRNLVKLYGCCIEADRRLLVYEYLQNKSLDQALFGDSNLHLNWSTRYDICLGTARGLAYLHEESRLRIVHRDVKASNILLDNDLNPKISDFGLAKLYDDKKTHISTRVAGTIGYLAPEYAMRGHLTEKADVFGFGVVALEILSGRPNSDSSLEDDKIYLLEWAWHLHENNRELELVDARLSEFDEVEVRRVIGIALLCIQASPMLRPSMSRVVAMLSGDIEVNPVTTKPGYLTDWKFNDETNFLSDISGTSTAKAGNSQYDSSSNPSVMAGVEQSPINAGQPMLHEIIGDGR